jgi:hypothetical protein
MQRQNITGRGIAYIRSQQNMSQEILTGRLQCLGLDINRKMLANIEVWRMKVKAEMLPYFQQALQVLTIRVFPPKARQSEARLAARMLPPSSKVAPKRFGPYASPPRTAQVML